MLSRRRRPSFVTTALLAVALLLAQGIGSLHRISHAGMQFTQGVAQADGDSLLHSCIAFDAATLGDVFHTPVFAPAFDRDTDGPPADAPFTSRTATAVCPFQPRAPPTA